ncbi:DUF4019 domain-containing protein [Arenimonas oryziterrae]|uniref:DUF4019 domain-containing protein n=1 Tax=Arenimonas oryziterrae DSM 21050 = YC6267 TaxID=1121015 RepID=A0A091AWN9_9GAMM|nr:DUF4019 domain-containing protein [Arenimonas oryziterrae]KFN43697.1 hypothetical protein N789_10495 [Arenimonas oryziterrae DSM 21050 = YC6267]
MRLALLLALQLLLSFAPVPARAADYSPTPADFAEIDRLTGDYYHALDTGNYRAAYAMQTPGLKAMMSFAQFEAMNRDGAAGRGPVKARTRTGVTWYLDPPNAQAPGLYVAVDFVAQHVTVVDAKEYLVWYRAPGETSFQLMRHEQTADLQPASGPPEPAPAPLPESRGNSIGYTSVREARAALSARTDVTLRPMEGGWFVVVVPSENAIWSFTPPGHAAYPAAVKRYTVESNGAVSLGMSALCEASKAACDDLMRQFQEMNAAIARQMQGGKGGEDAAPAETSETH